MPEHLVARLGVAKSRRNFLAHDFWVRDITRWLVGDTDTVSSELEADAQDFLELSQEIIQSVLMRASERRGVPAANMQAVSLFLVGTMLLQPDRLAHVNFWEDPDAVSEELATLLAELRAGWTPFGESAAGAASRSDAVARDQGSASDDGDVEVRWEDGRRVVQWVIHGDAAQRLVIRHDAPDALEHFYSPRPINEDLPLYGGEFAFSDSEAARPYVGHARLTWTPTPRVVVRGERDARPEDLDWLHRQPAATWVTAPTVVLGGVEDEVPPPPAALSPPPELEGSITSIAEERLGDQSIGDGSALEEVTFLVPNGWRSLSGGLICDPRDRRRRWAGRLEAHGGGWHLTIDALPETSEATYWRQRGREGGHAFTHIGRIVKADGTRSNADEVQDALFAVRTALSLALGRSTACLLPVGWADGAARWASWRVLPVDALRPVGTWLDMEIASHQVAEVVARVLDLSSDPEARQAIQYATAYYLTANADVDVELTTAIAVSGLQLLSHHRFVEARAVSHSQWKGLGAERQLRDLLDACKVPTHIPSHFEHLTSLRDKLAREQGGHPDALTCVMRLRNDVVHPTRRRRQSRDVYEWAEAGFAALHFLEFALLHSIGYRGKARSRLDSRNELTAKQVPWT